MTGTFGDFTVASVLDFYFPTVRDTGAPFTLAGTPAVSVYKDNSVTQSTSGVTLDVDFDSVTGLNHVRIDTSSDGTFYSAGASFAVVITTGTVNSVSVVGYVVGYFTLQKTSALRPATAGRTLVVDAAGLADANMVKAGPSGSGTALTARDIGASVLLSTGTGTGQLDFTSGVVKANLAQILGTALTETAGLLAGGFKKFFNVASPTMTALGVDQTGDSFARLGAPAGASHAADTAAIKAVLPSALVSGRIDASVGAMAANVLTATAINADAITAAKVADGTIDAATFAAGAINAAAIAADAITDAKVAADVTIASVTGAVGSVTGAVGSVTGAVGSVTGNVGGNVTGSVGSVATGGISAASFAAGAIDAAAIATDAIGANELAASAVSEIQSGLSTLDAAGVRTAVGLGSANLDTQLDALPTNAELATALASADDAVLAAIAALNNLSVAQVTGAVPTATENADALLKRDFSAVTGEATRSALNALRFLRNRWSIAGGTLTVTTEDDTTSAWTGAVTQTAGDPVSEIDPA